MIKASNDAAKYLEEHPLLSASIRFGEFALHRMVAYLHLRDYENGRKTAEESLDYFPEGSIHWMIFQEYNFLLSMHTGQFEAADEIFERVNSHPAFKSMEAWRTEKWTIFQAYSHFIMTAGQDSSSSEETSGKRFSLNKFLNEVPIYSKDKTGMNVAILILQNL